MDSTPAPGAATDATRAGLAASIAGICFVAASLGSAVADALWIVMIVGFGLLIYSVPHLHRHQAPADGAVGLWGSRLVAIGAGIVMLLGMVFLIWEAVGTPPEEGPIGFLWMIGFFGFVIGIILFAIGTLKAKVFPAGPPILMLVGLLGSLAIDMATGAFFEENGDTTEWGFYIGVPLFGLGVAWLGYSLWKSRPTAAGEPATPMA